MKVGKVVVLLAVTVVHLSSAVIHTLRYFYTSSCGIPSVPEFVTVGLFDGAEISYYDSNTGSVQLRQDWMKNVAKDDPHYLQNEARKASRSQMSLQREREHLSQHLNQTGGVHVLQRMYGCEWDDETNESLSGFYQYGYDGEDFISFNLTEEVWVAARREAEITKRRWEKHEGVKEHWRTYLTHRCISWVQEYVAYRESSLVRTVLPHSVSLLQKEPSSPVTCMATGFYPGGATLSWRRGEEELHEEVEPGEILPNPDGTFQMSAALDLSSVPPEDWSSYKCVFQLCGGQEVPTSLDRKWIRTNWGENPRNTSITTAIVGVAVAVLVLVLVLGTIAGFIVYRQKKGKCPRDEGRRPLDPKVKEANPETRSMKEKQQVEEEKKYLVS